MSADLNLANPRTLRYVLSEVERQVRDDLWGDVRSFVMPEGKRSELGERLFGARGLDLWPLRWQATTSNGRPLVAVQYNGWPVYVSPALPHEVVCAVDSGHALHAFEILGDGSVEPVTHPWAGRHWEPA